MTLPRLPTLAAVVALILVPWRVVGRHDPHVPLPPVPVAGPVQPARAMALDTALARNLFGTGIGAGPIAETAAVADGDGPPAVVGVVGRLPDQAVVLVRRAAGGTRSLSPGENVDGWRLDAVTATAVLFVSGDRRVRREVTGGDTPDQ